MVFASLLSTTLSVTPGKAIPVLFDTVCTASFVLSISASTLSPEENINVVLLAPGCTRVARKIERAIVNAVNWSLLASIMSITSDAVGLVTTTKARFDSLLTLGVLLEPPPQPT